MFVEAGGHLIVGTDPTGYGGVIAGFSSQRAVELLLDGDLLEDPAALRRISLVFKAGTGYNRQAIIEAMTETVGLH